MLLKKKSRALDFASFSLLNYTQAHTPKGFFIKKLIFFGLTLLISNITFVEGAIASCTFQKVVLHDRLDHTEILSEEKIENWIRLSKASLESTANEICHNVCATQIESKSTVTESGYTIQNPICDWRGSRCIRIDWIELNTYFKCQN